MKRVYPFILLLVCHLVSFSQVGIGTSTPNPRSILELSSNSKGFLLPRMTANERLTFLQPSLTSQDVGMMVFQTSPVKALFIYQGIIAGQHKWSCMPVANDGDPQGVSLRWDGTGWVNTDDLYFNNNTEDPRIGFFNVNPQSQLHVHGPGVTTQLQFTDFYTNPGPDDGLALGIAWASGAAYLNQRENKPLIFSTNNTERLKIDSTGRVGINKSNPEAKLDVNGNFKLGPSGALLTNIIRHSVNVDIPVLPSMSSVAISVECPNAMVSGTVFVSPANPLNDVMIGYSRVSSSNQVEIKFMNMGDQESNPPMMSFYVTVIQ